jgi:hypothetical protein
VELPGERPAPPASPARSLGRMHAVATAGMAFSAVTGVLALLLFITVGWPGAAGHYVITVAVVSVIVFITCCSVAVFAAARETYARSGGEIQRTTDE